MSKAVMSDVSKLGKTPPSGGRSVHIAARLKRTKSGQPPAYPKHGAKRDRLAATRAVWDEDDHTLKLFRTTRYDRVKLIKIGFPAKYVKTLSAYLQMPIDKLYRTTGLVRPTVDRKIRQSKRLSQDESERVMGIARLIGHAQFLVLESGGPADFDAGRWVGDWLQKPLPALNGKSPGELMDTMDGRALVSDLLAQQQSGAYG